MRAEANEEVWLEIIDVEQVERGAHFIIDHKGYKRDGEIVQFYLNSTCDVEMFNSTPYCDA